MSVIGNVLWLLLGGILVSLGYILSGLLLCLTIIGIPFGIQLIKIGIMALTPFGHDADIMSDSGCLSVVFNIIWVMFGWWEIALVHLACAAILALTIVGIPFAKAHIRIMKMSMLPFGSHVVSR